MSRNVHPISCLLTTLPFCGFSRGLAWERRARSQVRGASQSYGAPDRPTSRAPPPPPPPPVRAASPRRHHSPESTRCATRAATRSGTTPRSSSGCWLRSRAGLPRASQRRHSASTTRPSRSGRSRMTGVRRRPAAFGPALARARCALRGSGLHLGASVARWPSAAVGASDKRRSTCRQLNAASVCPAIAAYVSDGPSRSFIARVALSDRSAGPPQGGGLRPRTCPNGHLPPRTRASRWRGGPARCWGRSQ